MESKTVVLTRGEEKKHSWVYKNSDEGFSGVYVPKDILGMSPPRRIKVTFEAVSE